VHPIPVPPELQLRALSLRPAQNTEEKTPNGPPGAGTVCCVA
jgi:hypothetical protein